MFAEYGVDPVRVTPVDQFIRDGDGLRLGKLAAEIILTSIRDYLVGHKGSLKQIRVVINDEGMVKTFAKAWHDHIDT